MRFLAGFLLNHGMLEVFDRPEWLCVEGGSRAYVERMRERFGTRVTIRRNCAVQRVERRADGIRLITQDGVEHHFDEVILACHADQALRMVAEPTALECDLLGAFPYQPNVALLHHDTSLLPAPKRAWAAWNYRVQKTADRRFAHLSYDMNILQGHRSERELIVTLNAEDAIHPDKALHRLDFEHPQFALRSHAAQARHQELIRYRHLSYCGAYWGYGFHEDGYQSGLRVARAFAS